jgi:hypothetical protein
MKIKIITGFRKEQQHSIDAEEAHKAYYLFLNPDKRGVFNNGLAIIGAYIRGIDPDYQGTMGWNSTHTLDDDDMNEIRANRIDVRSRDVLAEAKKIAQLGKPELMNLPLSEGEHSVILTSYR